MIHSSVIVDFVKEYNNYLSLNGISNLIHPKEGQSDEINSLEKLFANSHTKYANQDSGLILFEELKINKINKNWIAFGEYLDYGLYYAINLISNEVFCIFSEDNSIDMGCAKNFDSFLFAWIEYLKLLNKRLKSGGNNFTKKELNDTYEKCVDLAGGKEYSEYYKFLVGI